MRQHSRWMRLLAVLLGLSLVAAACGDDDDDDGGGGGGGGSDSTEAEGGGADDPIAALQETGDADPECEADSDGQLDIGGLLAESGELGDLLGAPQIAGYEVALDDINAAGGVLDQTELAINQLDVGEAPEEAAPQLETHIQDNVDVILGSSASEISRSIIDQVTAECMVMISPSNTGPVFTTYDDDDLYFRTIAADVLQGRVLAETAIDEGAQSASIIYRNDDYGAGLSEFIAQPFEEAGGSVESNTAYDPEATSFDAEVQEIVDADPDALFFVTFTEGAQILGDLIEAGFNPADKQVYFVEGNMSDAFVEGMPDPSVMEGIRGTIPGSEPTEGFRARMDEKNPDLPAYTYGPETYDAVVVIALAAEAAESDQADLIAEQINGVTRDGTECTEYAECRDLIRNGEDIDYNGQSGALEFARPGEPASASYGIFNWTAEGAIDFDNPTYVETAIE
jgi:branched-chain amino acid transport system substrate-binding protein